MAKYVQQVQTQVMASGNKKAQLQQEAEKAARAAKKADEEKRKAELAELFKPVQQQQKVPFGVDPKTLLCQFFKAGQCQKGDKCKFSHDVNVERKEAKIDMYTDKRAENADDTMDKWDQDKLNLVVNQKHLSGNVNKPTEIVCKYFIDAIETGKYGWFWDCPNGDKCKYRHALPPGYVLKKKETAEERAEREEMEKENQITLEDFLETERHQLGSNLTSITEASFAKWKADKKQREATEQAEADKQKAEAYKQFKAGVKSGMSFSGRELFDFNPDWAAGDGDEDIADTDMREEDDGRLADEEGRVGGYLGEDDGQMDEDDIANMSVKDKGKQRGSSSNPSAKGDTDMNGDQSVSVNEELFGEEELAGLSDDDEDNTVENEAEIV